MKKIPLKELKAAWSEGSTLTKPLGLTFDCPACRDHQLHVPLCYDPKWGTKPVYRYAGTQIGELSISPTIVGKLLYETCGFRGWVKLGRVEYFPIEKKKRRWENMDSPPKAADNRGHERSPRPHIIL